MENNSNVLEIIEKQRTECISECYKNYADKMRDDGLVLEDESGLEDALESMDYGDYDDIAYMNGKIDALRILERDLKEANWKSFVEKYAPIKNVNDKNASYEGFMYETDSNSISIVNSHKPEHVFTLIENEGISSIIAGIHFVNRLGYFITKNNWTDKNEEIII